MIRGNDGIADLWIDVHECVVRTILFISVFFLKCFCEYNHD